MTARVSRVYTTWYEFKKDLEKELGRNVLNWYWLQLKPNDPLPWNESHMKAILSSTDKLVRSGTRSQRSFHSEGRATSHSGEGSD